MGMDWGFYNSNFMEHRDSNTASVLEKLAGTESSCHFLKAAAHFITISRVSGSKAGIFAGIILIAIGIKILLEHLVF